jgi:hypothetical protein
MRYGTLTSEIIAGDRCSQITGAGSMQKHANAHSSHRRRMLLLGLLLWGVESATWTGCSNRQSTKVVNGEVTFQGRKVDAGNLRFVPIEGTEGPASRANIIEGQYKISARGGVPLGKHRVEVNAKCKTGRKVTGRTVADVGQVDELATVGAPKYAGIDSTIVVEISNDSTGQIDIDIPAQ